MALEIRQNLKMSQQLVLTPQLQQAIKMLQLSRIELLEMVHEEMLENPVLEEEIESAETSKQEQRQESATSEMQETEVQAQPPESTQTEELLKDGKAEFKEVENFNWEDYLNTYNNTSEPVTRESNNFEDAPSFEAFLSQKTSLYDHLLWQLKLSNLDDIEKEIGTLLIGSINEDGYILDGIEEIVKTLSVSVEKVEQVLAKIQSFDPPGIAARNLKECLLIQVRFLGGKLKYLEPIISNHLNELQRKDYKRISRCLRIPLERVFELTKLLQELEPKPGRLFSEYAAEYVTPDVFVYKVSGEWTIVLNEDGMPKLKLSSFYQQMASNTQTQGETKDYVQNKLRSALWLIRSIHQRQRTLYRTVKAIIKFQDEFFDKGVGYLRPMVLKDIAEEIGVHESTVSRVTSNKYVHTAHGIFELKYFFNSGFDTGEGESVASSTVKNKIIKLIQQENPKQPYSDQELVDLLKTERIEIARRTIAKYREMLKILPSARRKQFF